MKQTAVEWLMHQMLEASMDKKTKEMHIKLPKDAFKQAKEMEKQQIIEALMTSEVELLSWGISAEKYYNQTFKSE